MGRDKATLPFGPEPMLARVVRIVSEVVRPVVVVAAVDQQLPDLPADVDVVRDRNADRGPLEGLAVGLKAVGRRAQTAFVTSCDVPLLLPGFVDRMIYLSAGYDVAVPHVGGYDQPLSAVYRTELLAEVEALLAADRLRPAFLFEQVRTRRIGEGELTDVDPDLDSLTNLNTPAHYLAALAKAGFGE